MCLGMAVAQEVAPHPVTGRLVVQSLVAGQLIGDMCECKIEISQWQKHNKTMDGVKFECSSRMEKVYTRTSPFTIGRLYLLR